MSSDLVERLRAIGHHLHGDFYDPEHCLCCEAMYRIEALEQRLAAAEQLLHRSNAAMGDWFSGQFDGGAQFSELTGDIPQFLAARGKP